MPKTARVESLKNSEITVVTLFSLSCANCRKKCSFHGRRFTVVNKNNIPLTEGSIVKIDFPSKMKKILGLASLLFPLASAVLALFLSPHILSLIGTQCTELKKFAVILAFMLISEGIVFIASRADLNLVTPEITGIL